MYRIGGSSNMVNKANGSRVGSMALSSSLQAEASHSTMSTEIVCK